jgi:hypothetical protein
MSRCLEGGRDRTYDGDMKTLLTMILALIASTTYADSRLSCRPLPGQPGTGCDFTYFISADPSAPRQVWVGTADGRIVSLSKPVRTIGLDVIYEHPFAKWWTITVSPVSPELVIHKSGAVQEFSCGPNPSETQCGLDPCEIDGDFDGDGKMDRAILFTLKGKRGIHFVMGNQMTYIVGGGVPIGNGGDDLNWMDRWELHRGDIQPKVKGDSLLVEKTESASAIIYWNGSGFDWYQQGD